MHIWSHAQCSDCKYLFAGALGALERKAGNYELALTYLDTALGLTPRHPAACVEKAMILRWQGKPKQADKFTEMAYKESTQLSYKRGNMEKSANQFVRSSEQQQVCCSACSCCLTFCESCSHVLAKDKVKHGNSELQRVLLRPSCLAGM